MKLKKLFAGIVAVAMVATMGAASVFAEGNTTTVEPSVDGTLTSASTVTITKKYTIADGMTAPAETFTFTLHADGARSGVAKDSKSIPYTMLDKTYTIRFENGQFENGTTEGKFDISLGSLGITKVGVYEYTLTESDGALPGVTYASPLKMTVSVTNPTIDGTDGTIDENASLNYTVALHREGVDGVDKKVKDDEAFENKYTAQKLTISKQVKGNLGDRQEVFTFNVTLTGSKDNYTYPAATVDDSAVTLPNGKENPETIPVDGMPHAIYLTHKGEAVINNLPKGVKYEIKEVASDAVDYTVSYKTGSDTTFNTGNTASGEIATVDATVDFVNKHEGTVDTGVILDNAPYIALMMVVVAGAAVMILKKRRHFED